MADAKITALTTGASVVGGDIIPYVNVAASVTQAISFASVFTRPTINQPSITGHLTIEGVGTTGATGTGKLVFDTTPTIAQPSITGHLTIEGVGTTGATGTGNIVFATSPSFSNPSVTGDAEFRQNITAGSVIGVNTRVGGGIGYITGAGSIVTQATNKTLTIVCNAAAGALTLNNSAMAASVITSFVVANSAMGVTDIMLMQHVSGGTLGGYAFAQSTLGGGNTLIKVRNNVNAAASEAIVVGFAIIKGAQS